MDDNQNLDDLDRETSELVRSMQQHLNPDPEQTPAREPDLVKVLEGITAVLINVRALLFRQAHRIYALEAQVKQLRAKLDNLEGSPKDV